MKDITPCIWHSANLSEMVDYYTTIFPNVEVRSQSEMLVELTMGGKLFRFLAGNTSELPNPSISFYHLCTTKDEAYELWERLSLDGQEMVPLDSYPWSPLYGWISDKFGISWQIAVHEWEEIGQKITPAFLFVNQYAGKARPAIELYSRLFDKFDLDGIMYFDETEKMIQHSQFALNGQKFMFMDSPEPHEFTFNNGISFMVECEDQAEIDHYWNAITRYGKEGMCGWCTDEFGVAWQIYPRKLSELMSNPETARRTAENFRNMKKIVVDELGDG